MLSCPFLCYTAQLQSSCWFMFKIQLLPSQPPVQLLRSHPKCAPQTLTVAYRDNWHPLPILPVLRHPAPMMHSSILAGPSWHVVFIILSSSLAWYIFSKVVSLSHISLTNVVLLFLSSPNSFRGPRTKSQGWGHTTPNYIQIGQQMPQPPSVHQQQLATRTLRCLPPHPAASLLPRQRSACHCKAAESFCP